MARQVVKQMRFPHPPETVLKAITNYEFHRINSLNHDNPRAEVKERSRTESEVVFVVESEEYVKGVTGVDRTRTEKAATTFTWNLRDKKASWVYEGPHGKRVKVWGDIGIQSEGAGSLVTEHFNVDIGIPLVGGKIEGIVVRETEAQWPKYEALLGEWCAKV